MAKADLGLVLYAIGSGTSVSFKNPAGISGTPRIVSSGVYRASDTFYAGAMGTTTISVLGNVGATAFGVVVGVERRQYDAANAANLQWSPVSTVRLDAQVYSGGPIGPAKLQTIARTDFNGLAVDEGDGLLASGNSAESLSITLKTTDLFLGTGGARLILRACSGALLSGDFVACSVATG